MIQHVVIDLHGVLAEFVEPWAQLSGLALPDPWPAGTYSLEEAFGLQLQGVWSQLLKKSTVDWWAKLPECREAPSVFKIAHVLGTWSIATSPRSPLAIRHHEAAGSTRLIAERYGCDVQIVREKAAIARPRWLLIDDSDAEVDAWRRAGGRAVVMPRPWNSWHRFAAEPIVGLMKQLEQLWTPAGGAFVVDLPLPPPAVDPNRRTKSHGAYRSAVRKYRETCEAMVRGQLLQHRAAAPRWRTYRIATTWRTDSGRRHDWTNAIASMKPLEDALQRAGVIANDVETEWERPSFLRAGSPARVGIEVVVTSTD